jgi:hypothetical protein
MPCLNGTALPNSSRYAGDAHLFERLRQIDKPSPAAAICR